jgi:HAD superfamily hydrolase (TIGR01459 family)
VADTLKELKNRKKFIILLSNTDEKADESAIRLKDMGLNSAHYDAIVTSGEMAWQGLNGLLTDPREDVFKNLGPNCYLVGGARTKKFLENAPVEIVSSPVDANFMLISGWDNLEHPVPYYDDILRECVRKRLKAICLHPDSRALMGSNYTTASGQVAARYQEFGGVVHYIGKPYKPIFYQCIKILHKNDIYPGQTVMIGDTMAHDILGATLVNMDTCLIKNGMHSQAFKNATTPADVNKYLNMLVAQYNNVRPTYLVDRFKWGKALPDRKHKKRKI